MYAAYLPRQFYLQHVTSVAHALLGKLLVVRAGQDLHVGIINETEAYSGDGDKASHASKGKTPRTKIMWESGGIVYVYLIYGMYHCINLVTGMQGEASAVLIRSVIPLTPVLGKTDGPGKLCREFGITVHDNGLDVTVPDSRVAVMDAGLFTEQVTRTPRIGVGYSEIFSHLLWRYSADFSQQEMQHIQGLF